MKRTLPTGLPSVMDYVDDGNLTKDGPWDYVWDADGARERADGARQSGVPGAKRRVRKAGARWATDEQNRLTAMTMKTGLPSGMIRKRLEFVYDYLGRRVQKKVLNNWTGTSGTTVTHLKYVYDGHNQIAELNGSVNSKPVLSTYVWGLDLSGTTWGAGGVGGLLMIKDGAKTYFPAYDGNGNLSALLDSADGSLDAKYEYGAFGEPLRVGGTVIAHDNPFRYSTKYTDEESGLVYYGFRYYSPSLGRFLNRDPIGELGGSNLYAFVENDPVNGWDRLGLAGSSNCQDPSYEAEEGDEICEEDIEELDPYETEDEFVLPDFLGENPHLVGTSFYDGSINNRFDGDFQVTGAGGGGGGAGGEDGCKDKKKQQEKKWKPNKEDCDSLRNTYPAAFTKPREFVPYSKAAVEDVMIAATIQSAADTRREGTEFGTYIRSSHDGIYYEQPGRGKIKTYRSYSYFVIPNPRYHPLIKDLAYTHSHAISYETYEMMRGPGVSLEQYRRDINSPMFSRRDRVTAIESEIPLVMHTGSNELRIYRPEFDKSKYTGKPFGNLPADIVNKLIECVKGGF